VTVSLKSLPAESRLRKLYRHERALLESARVYEEFAPVLDIVHKHFPDTGFLLFPGRPDRRGFISGPVLRWIDGPSGSEIYSVLCRDRTQNLHPYLVNFDRWDRIRKYVVSVTVGRSTTTFDTMSFSAERAVEKNQRSIDDIIDRYGGRNKYSVRALKSPGSPPEIPWGFWDDPSDIERDTSEYSLSPPGGPSDPQRNLIESLCLDLEVDPATRVSGISSLQDSVSAILQVIEEYKKSIESKPWKAGACKEKPLSLIHI